MAAGLPLPESTGYHAWIEEHFTEVERADESISGPDAAPAGDGIRNITRYALGLPPHRPARDSLPAPAIQELVVDEKADPYVTLTVRRREPLEDVAFHVEVSRDLRNWAEPAVVIPEQTRFLDDDFIEPSYRDPQPASNVPRSFLRLRLEWQEYE